jgi:prepilin-type N-terminal cleavage/methylation domain-containing protein
MMRKMLRTTRDSQGFTLVEMIGVLAIIAILMALLLPKVFSLIASSNARSLVAAVRTYETSVISYFADVGSLYPLNITGVPTAETGGDSTTAISLGARLTLDMSDPLNTGANQWPRFRGPYVEKFNTTNVPGFGATILMPTALAIALATPTTGTNIGWDLKGDDGNNDLATGAQAAYLQITGVTVGDAEEIDGIIDPGIGGTQAERQLRGRVKYDTVGGQLFIYLAHS